MEATFRRLAEMAAKAPEPSPLYQHLLAAFVDAVSADQAALALFDGDGVMRVAATHEIGADVAGGRCGWPTVADTAGTRAIAIVPLLVGGEVLGTLTAFFDRPRPVSETELGVARDLAAQGAAEIHRQRLEAGLGLANLALTAILDAAPDGITVQGPDGRLVFANQDAAALIGFGSPGELLAATPAEILARFELFDEDGVRMTRTELPGRRALQGEYPPDHLVRWRLVGADGSDDRWSLVSARPVFGEDGAVRFAVNVFRDVTERQRAAEALRRSERRLGFLAATSPRLLDSALDYAGVLDGVARLFVPDLADVCSVRELDADGMSRRVATTYSDAVEAAVAEHLDGLDRSPAAQLLDDLAARLPVLAPDVALLPDPRLGRALSRLGVQSAIAVPLRAGPTWLGDVTLLSMVEGRRYDEADLALVEEVARRAGLTAQNARLFQEQRSVASTLQRALLPPGLPDIPGVELAARYHAASSQIGGDFYDVVPIGPSRWMIAVGDVCGKGIESASLTAMVRYTLRAFARSATRPSDLLARLNDALRAQLDPDKFCTVALSILDTTGGQARLTVSLGGHPRPLLVMPGGAVRPVGTPGTLLGTLDGLQLADDDVVLQPGDALVYFTDGVGAASPGTDDDGLQRVLRQEAGASAACLAQAVEMVAHAERGYDDDLTVLVLRRLPPPR